MKKILVFPLLACIILSCAQVNPGAQQEYQEKKIRHGIVPHVSDVDAVAKISTQSKADPESIKRGQQIFQKNCIGCHGVAGDGVGAINADPNRPAANLRKTVIEVQNFDFFVSVSYWKANMPGWKSLLSEQQKNDLVSYIKTFKN